MKNKNLKASSAIIHSIIIDHISLFTTVRIALTFVYKDIACIIRVLVCLCGIKLCMFVLLYCGCLFVCYNALSTAIGPQCTKTCHWGVCEQHRRRPVWASTSAFVIRCLISIISILALSKFFNYLASLCS